MRSHAYCDDNSKALDLMGNALKVAWHLRDNPVLVASGGRPLASLAKHIAIALWLGVVMTILAIVFAVNAKAADVQVIDGDTFKMNGITYRLHGIDAPEGDQVCNGLDSAWHCGDEAVAALLALVAGQRVVCRPLGRDRYDRVLAKCWAGRRIEINDALVRHGVAWAFRRYSLDYVDAEQEARRENRGVWVAPNLPPWLWRKQNR